MNQCDLEKEDCHLWVGKRIKAITFEMQYQVLSSENVPKRILQSLPPGKYHGHSS